MVPKAGQQNEPHFLNVFLPYTMTRLATLHLLLCLSICAASNRILRGMPRGNALGVRDRNRDYLPDDPDVSTNAPPVKIAAPLRGLYSSFPSSSPSESPGEDIKVDLPQDLPPPDDGFGGPMDVPGPESNPDETSAEIPGMEQEAPDGSDAANYPPNTAGDQTDTPNAIDDHDPLSDETTAEIPVMEQAPVGSDTANYPPNTAGDQTDTPNATDDRDPLSDETTAEIPVMEQAPGGSDAANYPPDTAGDQNDTSNAIDDHDSPSEETTAEIPVMEQAPGGSDTTNYPPDTIDQTDTPNAIDGSADSPIILPFGNEAESFILHQTASVCADSQEMAASRCTEAPVCKYITFRGQVTSRRQTDQGDCVPRCDSPLGESECRLHEQCFHFVLNCADTGWA